MSDTEHNGDGDNIKNDGRPPPRRQRRRTISYCEGRADGSSSDSLSQNFTSSFTSVFNFEHDGAGGDSSRTSPSEKVARFKFDSTCSSDGTPPHDKFQVGSTDDTYDNFPSTSSTSSSRPGTSGGGVGGGGSFFPSLPASMFSYTPGNTPSVGVSPEMMRLNSQIRKLENKKFRYEEYLSALTKCIEEKHIPDEMRVDIKPVIRNLDDIFVEMWYESEEENKQLFHWDMFEITKEFCERSLLKLNEELESVRSTLRCVETPHDSSARSAGLSYQRTLLNTLRHADFSTTREEEELDEEDRY